MYSGYFSFAGTEIANAARTLAYVNKSIPSYHFRSCWESASLPCILGDGEYRSPALDPAPWFSEHRPASAKFYGFYPTQFDGVEDSSRSVTVTEMIQDGAIFSRPRQASKEFRVRGLMIAQDDEGLDAGMRWLRGALQGGCEEGCLGDEACYLAYLPDCCDYSNEDEYPVTKAWGWREGIPIAPYAGAALGQTNDGHHAVMPQAGDGVQMHLDGMIPGQPYRLELEMRSDGPLSVYVDGNLVQSGFYANEYHASANRGLTPWSMQFIAKGQTATFRVVSNSPDGSPQDLNLYRVKVTRCPEPVIRARPRFSYQNYLEASSWGFVDQSPSGAVGHLAYVNDEDEIDGLSLSWTNSTGSTISLGANTRATRLLRSLDIGEKHVVTVRAESSSGAALDISVDGATGFSDNLGNGWLRFWFTPTKTQHYLRIFYKSGFTIPDGGDETILITSLNAQVDVQYLYPAIVDQMEPAQRHLHGVTLLNGPNVIREYPQRGGAMCEVEFSMAVARPDIYGARHPIAPSIESTTALVSTGSCSYGEPVRTNWFTNPYFSNLLIGGVASGGIGTIGTIVGHNADVDITAPPSVAGASQYGSKWLKVERNGSNPDNWAEFPFSMVNLREGHTYTFSCYAALESQTPTTSDENMLRLIVTTGGGQFRSNAPYLVDGVSRLSVTFVYDGTLQRLTIHSSNTDAIYATGFLFEEAGTALAPYDGDNPPEGAIARDVSWGGTANASRSIFKKAKPILLADPDCDEVPTAPQPPSITPACPRTADEWRRHWVEVPANLAGGWNESIPVVTLTTNANAVKDVRIRFYPNPLGVEVDDLDACGYCGEFYISYIPKNAVMTIDGIYRTAIVNIAGSGDQRAMHLVSDVDYGPVSWPAMTCDTGYYMAVDIAPDEIQDVDVRLDVALKG